MNYDGEDQFYLQTIIVFDWLINPPFDPMRFIHCFSRIHRMVYHLIQLYSLINVLIQENINDQSQSLNEKSAE